MAIQNGNPVEAGYTNSKLMSRTSDTGTTGKFSLSNTSYPESGAAINNTQRAVNETFDAVGMTGEGDATRKDYSSNNVVANGDSHKVAIGKVDTDLGLVHGDIATLQSDVATLQTDVATLQGEMIAVQSDIDDISNNTFTFGGDKTFSDDVTINGDLTVNGTTTSINTVNLDVEDALVTINKNGNDATAEGSGFQTERVSAFGQFLFDSTLLSKWKLGTVGNLYEVLVTGLNQIVTGVKDFTGGIKSDTISESTLDAGVTVDGVLIKDGAINKSVVGLVNVTNDAQLKRSAADIDSFTEKVTPVNDDIVIIEDSADSFNKKKVKFANITVGGGGETNTASNVGGYAEVFKQKTGVDLEFRTLLAGENTTITEGTNEVTIGETFTAAQKKNWVLNGGFDVWQRGDSFASSATSTAVGTGYSADRWRRKHTDGDNSLNVSREETVYADSVPFRYVARLTSDTDDLYGSSDTFYLSHSFEQQDVIALRGKEVTVSYYRKITANTDLTAHSASIRYSTTPDISFYDTTVGTIIGSAFGSSTSIDGSYVRVTNTFTVPTDANSLGIILLLQFPILVSPNDTIILLSGVMLNEGPTAAPFVTRNNSFESELSECKRFYQKSAPYADVVSISLTTWIATHFDTALPQNTQLPFGVRLEKEMRKTPTFVLYSAESVGSGSGQIYVGGTAYAAVVERPSATGFARITNNQATTWPAGSTYIFNYTANAEM